jgi:hypothetical protein
MKNAKLLRNEWVIYKDKPYMTANALFAAAALFPNGWVRDSICPSLNPRI